MGFLDIFKKNKPKLNEDQLKIDKMWNLWTEGKAQSPYAELMTYQSEIGNGGHSQYFFNVENVGDLQKELAVLERILPVKFSENLQRAYKAYLALEENEDDEAAEATLEYCDNIFYENESEINALLEEYAAKIKL